MDKFAEAPTTDAHYQALNRIIQDTAFNNFQLNKKDDDPLIAYSRAQWERLLQRLSEAQLGEEQEKQEHRQPDVAPSPISFPITTKTTQGPERAGLAGGIP